MRSYASCSIAAKRSGRSASPGNCRSAPTPPRAARSSAVARAAQSHAPERPEQPSLVDGQLPLRQRQPRKQRRPLGRADRGTRRGERRSRLTDEPGAVIAVGAPRLPTSRRRSGSSASSPSPISQAVADARGSSPAPGGRPAPPPRCSRGAARGTRRRGRRRARDRTPARRVGAPAAAPRPRAGRGAGRR